MKVDLDGWRVGPFTEAGNTEGGAERVWGMDRGMMSMVRTCRAGCIPRKSGSVMQVKGLG